MATIRVIVIEPAAANCVCRLLWPPPVVRAAPEQRPPAPSRLSLVSLEPAGRTGLYRWRVAWQTGPA